MVAFEGLVPAGWFLASLVRLCETAEAGSGFRASKNMSGYEGRTQVKWYEAAAEPAADEERTASEGGQPHLIIGELGVTLEQGVELLRRIV